MNTARKRLPRISPEEAWDTYVPQFQDEKAARDPEAFAMTSRTCEGMTLPDRITLASLLAEFADRSSR